MTLPYLFFSSRRRHTISYGDWSSDVGSSDLYGGRATGHATRRTRDAVPARASPQGEAICLGRTRVDYHGSPRRGEDTERGRSEERRVGKECRRGRWPGQNNTATNTPLRPETN